MSENYNIFLRERGPSYFSGPCDYMASCPDNRKLMTTDFVNEDLADQFYELCTVGGRCLNREKLEDSKD